MDNFRSQEAAAPLPCDIGESAAADDSPGEVVHRLASVHQRTLMALGGQAGPQGLAQENSTSFFQPVLDILKLLNQNDISFYMFSRQCLVRKACFSLTEAPSFSRVVLLLVVLNCMTLAMDPGPCDAKCKDSDYMRALFVTDTFFTACFTLEILCQAIAHCFLLGPSAYLHDGWNWIDLLSTASGYVMYLPVVDGGSGINGLRGLRALRPLRALKAIPGLRRLVQCLLEVVPLLLDVLFLLFWVFFAFGIIALNVFMGALHRRCVYYFVSGTATAPAALLATPAPPPWPNGIAGVGTDGSGAAAALISGNNTSIGSSSSSSRAAGGSWMIVPGLEDAPCSASGAMGASKCPSAYDGFAVSCLGKYHNPNFGYTGFDNFGKAAFNIFAVLTLDGWSQLQLYPLWNALGPGLPIAFFSLLVLFGAFFTMQLVVAIMSSKFAQLEAMARSEGHANRSNATASVTRLEDLEEHESSSVGGVAPAAAAAIRPPLRGVLGRAANALVTAVANMAQRYGAAKQAVRIWVYEFKLRHMQPAHRVRLPPWRRRVYSLVHHDLFLRVMTGLILVNTVALAMDHYGISPTWFHAIDITNNILTYIFILELVLKHVAAGVVRYWTDPWDILDGLVVAVSAAEIVLVATGGGRIGTQALRTLRVLRILRTLKLLRRVKSLHRLVKLVMRGFYALGNFLLLTLLFVFVFAVLGLHQFGGLWSFQPAANLDDPGSARSNFNTLWESGYTVFQILTCDDWLRIAWNAMRGSGDAAVLYFSVWVVIGNFTLLSLFLAILITSFNTAAAEDDDDDGLEESEQTGSDDDDRGPYTLEAARSSVATIDSRQAPRPQTLRRRRRHRGGGGSGAAADDASNSVAVAAGGGTAAAVAAPNALQQRVVERVSERLDPARVKIMKRWLVMIGITHGMRPDEVDSIIKELDARVSFDPESVRLDSSFTTPHRPNHLSMQLGGLLRTPTLSRRMAPQLDDDEPPAATAAAPLPPAESAAALRLPVRRTTTGGTSSLRRISAAVDRDGAAGASDGAGGSEYGMSGVCDDGLTLGYPAELSPGVTKGTLRLPLETAAAAAAGADAHGNGHSRSGSGSEYDGDGCRSHNPMHGNPGTPVVASRGAATPPHTSASAPLAAVLADRAGGGVAAVLERLAHAIRKLGVATGSPGAPGARKSAPGSAARGDTASLPLLAPPNGGFGGGRGYSAAARRRSVGGMEPPRQRARYNSCGGTITTGLVSITGYAQQQHHHPQHHHVQAQHGPTRMGRAPATLETDREESWAMLLPRSEALLRYQRMQQQHQQRLEEAWVQERLWQWLHESHLALRLERSDGGEAVAGIAGGGGCDVDGDCPTATAPLPAYTAREVAGLAGPVLQRPSRFAVAASVGQRTDTGDVDVSTSGLLPSDAVLASDFAVVSRAGLAEEGDEGDIDNTAAWAAVLHAAPPRSRCPLLLPGSRSLTRNLSTPALRASAAITHAEGGAGRGAAEALPYGNAVRSPWVAATAAATAALLQSSGSTGAIPGGDSGDGDGGDSGPFQPMGRALGTKPSGLVLRVPRPQDRALHGSSSGARSMSRGSLSSLLPSARARPSPSPSQQSPFPSLSQSQSLSQFPAQWAPRTRMSLLSRSYSHLHPSPPPLSPQSRPSASLQPLSPRSMQSGNDKTQRGAPVLSPHPPISSASYRTTLGVSTGPEGTSQDPLQAVRGPEMEPLARSEGLDGRNSLWPALPTAAPLMGPQGQLLGTTREVQLQGTEPRLMQFRPSPLRITGNGGTTTSLPPGKEDVAGAAAAGHGSGGAGNADEDSRQVAAAAAASAESSPATTQSVIVGVDDGVAGGGSCSSITRPSPPPLPPPLPAMAAAGGTRRRLMTWASPDASRRSAALSPGDADSAPAADTALDPDLDVPQGCGSSASASDGHASSCMASPSSAVLRRMASAMNQFTWGPAAEPSVATARVYDGGCGVGAEESSTTSGDRSGKISGTGTESPLWSPHVAETGAVIVGLKDSDANAISASLSADDGDDTAAATSMLPFAALKLTSAAAAYSAVPRWHRARRGNDSSSGSGGGRRHGGFGGGGRWKGGGLWLNPFYEPCGDEEAEDSQGGPAVASARGSDGGNSKDSGYVRHAFTGVYRNPIARSSSSGSASSQDTLGQQPGYRGRGLRRDAAAAAAATTPGCHGAQLTLALPSTAAAALSTTTVVERRQSTNAGTATQAAAAVTVVAAPPSAVSTAAASGASHPGSLTLGLTRVASASKGPLAPHAVGRQPSSRILSTDLGLGAPHNSTAGAEAPMGEPLAECNGASGLPAGGRVLPTTPAPMQVGMAEGLQPAAAVAAVSPFTKCLSGRSENSPAWVAAPPKASAGDGNNDHTGRADAAAPSGAIGRLPAEAAPYPRKALLGKSAAMAQAVSEPGVAWPSPTADILGNELVLKPGGSRKSQVAVPSPRRWAAAESQSPVRDAAAAATATAAVGKTARVVREPWYEASAEDEAVLNGSAGSGSRGPVAEAAETWAPSAAADGGVDGGNFRSSYSDIARVGSCSGDPWGASKADGRRNALLQPGHCGVGCNSHGSRAFSTTQGHRTTGAKATRRLFRTLLRLSVRRFAAARGCRGRGGGAGGRGVSSNGNAFEGRQAQSSQYLPRNGISRSGPSGPGGPADCEGASSRRHPQYVSERGSSCEDGWRGTASQLWTAPGPLCEGLLSPSSPSPQGGLVSTFQDHLAADATPDAGTDAAWAVTPPSHSPGPSLDVPPPRSFRRTFSAAATSSTRMAAAAAAAVAAADLATATAAGSEPLLEPGAGPPRRNLHTFRSFALRVNTGIEPEACMLPSRRRLLVLQQHPSPLMERRMPPPPSPPPQQQQRRRLMHSSSSRYHSSRAERLATEAAAAAVRLSGSGMHTGNAEKWSVSWAREHGPRNAAEMEAALFAPLQPLVSAPRSRMGRHLARHSPALDGSGGGFGGGDGGGSSGGLGSGIRMLFSSGRHLNGARTDGENEQQQLLLTDGSGGVARSRLGGLGVEGLRLPAAADAEVLPRESRDDGAEEVAVVAEPAEVAGGSGGGDDGVGRGGDGGKGPDAGGGGGGGNAVSTLRPPALTIDQGSDGDGVDGVDGGHDNEKYGVKSTGSVHWRDAGEDPAPYLAYPAFCCIGGHTCVRQIASAIILNRWFDYGILAVILGSSAILAVNSPRLDPSSPLAHAVAILDLIFTVVFTAEMVIKVVAKGLVLHRYAYLRNGWDVLDCVIVGTSLLSLGLSTTRRGAGGESGALKSVRLVRTLRPLRLVRRLRGMRRVVETLIRSLPTLFEVLLFGVFQFGLFGILGVQLFAGRMSVCSQATINSTRVTHRAQCIEGVSYVCGDYDLCPEPGAEAVRWWGPPMRNFDHLGRALLTLFTVITLDGYMEVARSCMDAVGVDRVPQENHAPYMGLYVLAFIFLGSFFWVNLLVSVIIDHYARILAEEGDLLVTKQAKEYIRIFQFERNGTDLWKGGCPPEASALRRICWKVASHQRFDAAVTVNIVINIAAMAAVYDNTPRAYDVALALVNVVCTCGFAVEAWFKIVALGLRKYIRDNWNKLDLFIIAVSIPDIVSSFTPMSAATGFVTVLRLLRVLRMFKLIKSARGLRTLFNTLISSSPAIANVGSLLLLLMYIYAVIGMNMYGDYGSAFDQPGSHATYNNIGAAMATQFRLFTGDGWGDLMATGMNCDANQYQCDAGSSALVAALFFCSFVLVAIFIMLNLVIAVVVDNFIDNAQLEGLLKTSNFVDLLQMVITLRVFVLLMRRKIDAVRNHYRALQLTTHASSRLISSRRTRSRSISTNTVPTTPASPNPGGYGIGGIAGSMGAISAAAAAASTVGGSIGFGGFGESSFNGSARSISGLRSSSFLPRLARAVTRIGIIGGGGSSSNGFGSVTSTDGSGFGAGSATAAVAITAAAAGSGAAAAAAAALDAAPGPFQTPYSASHPQRSGSSPAKPSLQPLHLPIMAQSQLATIGPVLPRQQHSSLLLSAAAAAQRAPLAEEPGNTEGPDGGGRAPGGGDGSGGIEISRYASASGSSGGGDGAGSGVRFPSGGVLALHELRERLLRRRRRQPLLAARKRRLRFSGIGVIAEAPSCAVGSSGGCGGSGGGAALLLPQMSTTIATTSGINSGTDL